MAGTTKRSRTWRRRLRIFAGMMALNVMLLVLLDGLLVWSGALRPPIVYGDADVGFFGDRRFITSSDLGVDRPFPDSAAVVVAEVGDSHSELGPREHALARHQFVMEQRLRDRGVPAVVLAGGRGRYAPLQEYVLFKTRMRGVYHPSVLVMNLYCGNDFYDMLRPDDRPHFGRRKNGSIVIEKPLWNSFADPTGNKWRNESRLLWVFKRLLRAAGYPKLITRVRALSVTTRGMGGGPREIVSYLRDVNASIEPHLPYAAAFSAQVLNQALFYKHFPDGERVSMDYLSEMLAMVRRENPDLMLVMAPVPSAVLAEAMPEVFRDDWERTLGRVGVSDEYLRTIERRLYDTLKAQCKENGWIFVDTLPAFVQARANEGLYNLTDLHIADRGCRILGVLEADAVEAALKGTGAARP